MTSSKKLILAKARAFTLSIQKMNPKERSVPPSGQYGEDYNALRAAVARTFPELLGFLPPELMVGESQLGQKITASTYAEIDAYCEQLYQLVSECGMNDQEA